MLVPMFLHTYTDAENILAAWGLAVEQPALIGEITKFQLALSTYLEVRGLASTAVMLWTKALQLYDAHEDQVSAHERLRLLTHLGWFYGGMGDYDSAERVLKEAMCLADLCDQAYALDVGFMLIFHGWIAHLTDKPQLARNLLQQGLELCQKSDFEFGHWMAVFALGELEFSKGMLDTALHHYRDGYSICQHSPDLVSYTLAGMGCTQAALGDLKGAYILLRQSLQINRNFLIVNPALDAVAGIAILEAQQGMHEQALATLAMIHYHPQRSGTARPKAEHLINQLRPNVPGPDFERIMGQAKQHRLSHPYLQPDFLIDTKLIDQILAVLDQLLVVTNGASL